MVKTNNFVRKYLNLFFVWKTMIFWWKFLILSLKSMNLCGKMMKNDLLWKIMIFCCDNNLEDKYRVSQKTSVISGVWCKVVPLTLLYGVFSIFFGNFSFFWYSNGPKKICELFFSQNQKFRKAKILYYILFLSNSKIL